MHGSTEQGVPGQLTGKAQGSHGSMLPGLMWVDFGLKYIHEGYKRAFPPIITAELRPMRRLQVAQYEYGGGSRDRRSGTGKARHILLGMGC